MGIQEISIDSSIEEKIQWAKDCYENLGEPLLKDEEIKILLSQFQEAVLSSHKEMSLIGIDEECRGCEEKEGGTCCGAGLENKYSGSLLLINLMMNRSMPEYRYDPKGCYFLGNHGCTLMARHVICVNYICRKITESIVPENIQALREKEGFELEILFILNEKIKRFLMQS